MVPKNKDYVPRLGVSGSQTIWEFMLERTNTEHWINVFIELVRKWYPSKWAEENGQIIHLSSTAPGSLKFEPGNGATPGAGLVRIGITLY